MRASSRLIYPAAFAALTVFYVVTATQNHSTAVDAYGFAYWITEYPITAVPELRLFLWVASMQAIYSLVDVFVPDPDPFYLFAILNAAQMALAVLLLQRLLEGRLGAEKSVAWMTAALFAVCYGTWRYAAELEVYSTAALLSSALMYAALSLETSDALRRLFNLVLLAGAGGLATLAYQPLGIVAGFAVPLYLFFRLGLGRVALYLAVSGVFVAGGLALARVMAGGGEGLQAVFDTDGKPLALPGLSDVAVAGVAALQNGLSINWVFAFDPTRALIETHAGPRYQLFLYPAQFADLSALVCIATLPLACTLLLAVLVIAWRKGEKRSPSAVDAAVWVWLLGQAAMVLLIDPTGFEAWIPALLPSAILIGYRVLGPLVEAGSGKLIAMLIAVFLVHNWFSGIAVLGGTQHSLYAARSDAILAQTQPGDVLVVGTNWSFERYLGYASDAKSILLRSEGVGPTREEIDKAIAAGVNVYLFEDLPDGRPGSTSPDRDPDVPWSALIDHYRDRLEPVDLEQVGTVFRVSPAIRD